MSLSEIDRFVADSTSQSGLRDALAGVTRLDDVIEIAREHDYLISIEDVRAHLAASTPSLQLSDERLDAEPASTASRCAPPPPVVLIA